MPFLSILDDAHVAEAVKLMSAQRGGGEVKIQFSCNLESFDCDMEYATKNVGRKGDEALIEHIAPALAKCQVPVHLEFYLCNISDDGISALAHAVIKARTLTFLELWSNPLITSEAYAYLKKALVTTTSPVQQVKFFNGNLYREVTSPAKLRCAGVIKLDVE
jgi:hypothetical protein